MSLILYVFPRKTSMTPAGPNVVINRSPGPFDVADEIQISVAFTADLPRAEELADEWKHVAPVSVGGPAYDDPGRDFIPGRYIADGNVITHRGCPNSCWFCDAWKREGHTLRLLPIHEGHNLLDNNIWACSQEHQEKVYQMLLRQPKRPKFTGGLEAARMTEWNAQWLEKLKPEYAYFAYDEPRDWEPLAEAAFLLRRYELFRGHSMGCYVLIGDKKDTFEKAERRLYNTMLLGFMPQAMLLNRGAHFTSELEQKQWKRFQREWANKIIVGSKMTKLRKELGWLD